MTNLRVKLLRPDDVNLCPSEKDVSENGWTVTVPDAAARESPSEIVSAESFSGECCEVFHDGEFVGDNRLLEVTPERARLVYAPVPPED